MSNEARRILGCKAVMATCERSHNMGAVWVRNWWEARNAAARVISGAV